VGVDRRQRREAPPGRREPDQPRCAASRARAQTFAHQMGGGLKAGEVTALPGYYTLPYTLHTLYTLYTLKDGKIVGMVSVNAVTGAAGIDAMRGLR
jgi:hypothetical protein